MAIYTWSWIFLVVYIAGMLIIGFMGQRRVKHADDFATARASYGPMFLAFAFAATTASGATFLGGPGLAYTIGFSTTWGNFLYPMGVYFGVLISMRLIATAGNRFGNRSIPEFLGDRYQSEGIRIIVSVLSLVLFFYIAGQLVAGLVMFETMLGMSPLMAISITSVVLLIYVVAGGAHADILTDGIQGMMMLGLAVVVVLLVLFGVGIDGNIVDVVKEIGKQDPNLAKPLNPDSPLTHSPWSIIAILIAHIPLGLLPHLGNKLWALKSTDQQKAFVKMAFIFGLTLGMMGLGGLLARAVLGDALLAEDANQNAALPVLFIQLFPAWLAALIGVGVLAAIMSTADGLVVSSSQVVANDLYRRTIAPRYHASLSSDQLDRRVLLISRLSTVVILIACAFLGWALQKTNIAIIVWIGAGGMMSAFAGPLVLGALWRGVTKQGAYAGLIGGFLAFVTLYMQWINPEWFGSGVLHTAATWVHGEGPNPFSCGAMGEIFSVLITFVVSKLTQPLPENHVDEIFGKTAAE